MSGATDLYYRLTVGTPLSSKLLSYSVLVSKPYQDNDRSIKPDQMGPADPWDNEHLGWPPKPHLDATKPGIAPWLGRRTEDSTASTMK